ncbi:hypothetical protein FPSE_11990 [Fusarium pseudograminearum CS3096]|uniref:Uncharacterized protein n=1 Tax=Fusarium pseudograminearum (strain CS3096) TaxID=1028729 RepID=K3V471_FUSPC|nr:hypothetical protein FPSE_11990 [Fusarium pseudograminearum CS3096]EKJ67842.1 hypothetical protein FPSE_11990 [Fusarium pseudograminearum CS3096]
MSVSSRKVKDRSDMLQRRSDAHLDITNGTLSISQEGDSDESQENKSRPVSS